VLLAIGRRGTPRKLPFDVPPNMASKVHYALADARSFAGKRLLIVGLGDMAMETAIAISCQPGSQVTVVYRGGQFSRGKSRNIDELKRRVTAGAVEVLFETDVTGIEDGRAILSSRGAAHAIAFDAMFVMIGSILPTAFLERVGLGASDEETEV
jgi:thioredoxin reductase